MSQFDVFLCHNSADKSHVKTIGEHLKSYGLKPWLDEWNLRPGLPWQVELESQIGNIRAVAIFVGDNGIGPWHDVEINAFIREFVKRKCQVIPVILSNCMVTPLLPIFLQGFHWVDLRKNDPNPMLQLIWGITGEKPAENTRVTKYDILSNESTYVPNNPVKEVPTVQLVDAAKILTLEGHRSTIDIPQFNRDGKMIVTYSSDWTARIWNSENGLEFFVINRNDSFVTHAKFNLTDNRVAISFHNGLVQIWDVEERKKLLDLKGHKGNILHSEFSNDGKMIVSSSLDNTVRIWNAKNGKKLHVIQGDIGYNIYAQITPDGKKVFTYMNEDIWYGILRVWDLCTGRELYYLRCCLDDLNLSRDGKKFITCSKDKVVSVRDVETGKLLYKYVCSEYPKYANFSPDGKHVIFNTSDALYLWDLESNEEGLHKCKLISKYDSYSGLRQGKFSPCGRLLVYTDRNTIRLYDTTSLCESYILEGYKESILYCPEFSPDGKRILYITNDKRIHIWDYNY